MLGPGTRLPSMPFHLGGPELVFILVIVLIVFGAGRLPNVIGQLGHGVRKFREEMGETTKATSGEQPKQD